jgi:hypothetical protein
MIAIIASVLFHWPVPPVDLPPAPLRAPSALEHRAWLPKRFRGRNPRSTDR